MLQYNRIFPPKSSIFVLYFSNEESVRNISMIFSCDNIDDIKGKRRYRQNILHWSKNDFKSKNNTNGDYFNEQLLIMVQKMRKVKERARPIFAAASCECD